VKLKPEFEPELLGATLPDVPAPPSVPPLAAAVKFV
jgi:hypothetical protein